MLDARGLACPMPVIMVQKEVKANAPELIEVLVDEHCAVENISRFAKNNGYNVTVEDLDDEYKLILRKN